MFGYYMWTGRALMCHVQGPGTWYINARHVRLVSTDCRKVTEMDGKIGPQASSHLKYARNIVLCIELFSIFRSEYC